MAAAEQRGAAAVRTAAARTAAVRLLAVVAALGLTIGLKQGRLWASIVALVLASLAALTTVYDTVDVSNGVDGVPDGTISVGWGLWLTLVASLLAVLASIIAIVRRS